LAAAVLQYLAAILIALHSAIKLFGHYRKLIYASLDHFPNDRSGVCVNGIETLDYGTGSARSRRSFIIHSIVLLALEVLTLWLILLRRTIEAVEFTSSVSQEIGRQYRGVCQER